MDLSLDDIQQLSPDEASLKAAKGLVIPAKWPLLGLNDVALWGECQGSGSKPYQVQVDKSGPAFKCRCPSRKFPCKHGLALLLLHNQNVEKFQSADSPAWVNDWIASRQEKVEKQAARKADEAAVTPDPVATAKREQARAQRMLNGLEELELWLKDQIRQGLAQLSSQVNIGQQLATRLVDAQLPGLANRLRHWPAIIARDHWPEQMLAEFGELQLLIDGYRRITDLPENAQSDLLSVLGVPIDKDAVITHGEKISDDWLVIGQRIFEEERLWVRRVWLRGKNSNRFAFLLDFSHGTRQFEYNFITGTSIKTTLAFYPGTCALRALLIDKPDLLRSSLPAEINLTESLNQLAKNLAANPWQWPQPFFVSHVVPVVVDSHWFIVNSEGQHLTLNIDSENAWQLLAESGGKSLHVFGEWDDENLRPLSAWRDEFVWSEGN